MTPAGDAVMDTVVVSVAEMSDNNGESARDGKETVTVTSEVPTLDNVRDFCLVQQKKITNRATARDVKTLSDWLSVNKSELHPLEWIPHSELNEYITQFLIYIRKADGSQYQPGTLTNMYHSFDQ